MDKTLPKGHLSCLSDAFRYTGASETNVLKTFARVKRELGRQDQRAMGNVRVLPQRERAGGKTR